MEAKKRVLVIDDNVELRENTCELLEILGFSAIEAMDGNNGIDLALQHLPDIILCDIMMPQPDGYAVLQTLQQHDHTSVIPFIFLTAMSETKEAEKGIEMGAHAYIVKPFDEQVLLETIERLLISR